MCKASDTRIITQFVDLIKDKDRMVELLSSHRSELIQTELFNAYMELDLHCTPEGDIALAA